MDKKTLILPILLTLVCAFGCKKDDKPEENDEQPAPEKVEEPDKGAESTDDELAEDSKEPKGRRLVRNKPRTATPAKTNRRGKPKVTPRTASGASARNRALRKNRKEREARKNQPQAPDGMPPRGRDPVPVRTPTPGATHRLAAHPTGQPGVTPASASPNAQLLLREQDIKEVLKLRKKIDVHQLSGGKANIDDYDGIYWGSPDGKKLFAGLQIWQPKSPVEAQRRYSQMLRSFPNAQESPSITKKTFLAHWNDFYYLVFFEPGKQTVVNMTCHRKACTSPQRLLQLATRIKDRL